LWSVYNRRSTVPELSVVVPVYGCAGCLRDLHARLGPAIERATASYELIFVDDGSDDGSWELISELSRADPRVHGYRLSRNYGQHAAITAGLQKSSGGRVVVMDCDLQDPPEDIPRLYAKASEGYDIVFGRRRSKPTSWHRRALASLYFAMLNRFTGANIDGQQGTFSIISRKVVEAFLQFSDRDRHYLLILRWLGFSNAVVDYETAERAHGPSSYSMGALVKHAFDGVFFQTTVLLRWIVYLGFVLATAGAFSAVYLAYARVVGNAAPGWTSLAVFTLTIGGFIIISTGVTGLYIGKVFEQVKGRPLFVYDSEVEDGVEKPVTDRPASRTANPL
jgi:glycosyltransferase involved in cell wall biosynthesis